jgi:peptidoglycan hydrolase CwlO-like protein
VFIEILKIIGSAAVTACATIFALYLKRKWELKDRKDDQNKSVDDKLDELTVQVENLQAQVRKLTDELLKEDAITESLQAGLRELLYDRIKNLTRVFISDGKIREEDYKSLNRMWSVYHNDLEGNGYLNGEMHEVDQLEKY